MTAPREHSLELKIPPPAVAVLLAAAMWAIAMPAAPALPLPAALLHVLTAAAAVTGLACDACALAVFLRARTTVNPLRPAKASALVTGGIYRYTRNPMYLGLLLLLTAWALHLAAPWPFAGPVIFVLYMSRFQIAPEERALTALFGEDYVAYAARVRRWL